MQEHEFDVIVVGAGLSGVGAGYRLQTECPDKRYAILEARDAIGGTWDLFRYPGVRSDSDMFTLGYPFRPWKGPQSIADGASILEYIRDTAAEHGIDRHIRFRRRIAAATWSSDDARWTLDVAAGDARTPERYTCRFLYLCSGYYRYDAAHTPDFPGQERFAGRIIHPQWWPADLDYTGKRVVVIGSGATAVTLVPAMAAGGAAHVTMLQRSPTYIASLPARDKVADALRARCPSAPRTRVRAGRTSRSRSASTSSAAASPTGRASSSPAGRRPVAGRRHESRRTSRRRYRPWDQRLCLVPDGDLFAAMRAGTADGRDRHDRDVHRAGIRLASGTELPADLVVTATGLELLACGGIRFTVDGQAVEPRDTLFYKGAMLSGVPNLAWCVGYINASWTLRADLASRFVCRLLREMDRRGAEQVVARVHGDAGEERPLLDLASGYVARAAERFPRQGANRPWYLRQNYILDLLTTVYGRIENAALEFTPARPHADTGARPARATHAR